MICSPGGRPLGAFPRRMDKLARRRYAHPDGLVRAVTRGEGDLATQAETAAAEAQPRTPKPGLVFFHSKLSGRCRRTEGFLAQVLQRRRNHGTFRLYRVAREDRPELVERFSVERFPTLVILEDKQVKARLEQPRGCREIESFLAPWLK